MLGIAVEYRVRYTGLRNWVLTSSKLVMVKMFKLLAFFNPVAMARPQFPKIFLACHEKAEEVVPCLHQLSGHGKALEIP
jgi:hypothetical protein